MWILKVVAFKRILYIQGIKLKSNHNMERLFGIDECHIREYTFKCGKANEMEEFHLQKWTTTITNSEQQIFESQHNANRIERRSSSSRRKKSEIVLILANENCCNSIHAQPFHLDETHLHNSFNIHWSTWIQFQYKRFDNETSTS